MLVSYILGKQLPKIKRNGVNIQQKLQTLTREEKLFYHVQNISNRWMTYMISKDNMRNIFSFTKKNWLRWNFID